MTDQAKHHFEARLICLNKVYPRTPHIDQYRPIVVTSSIIKFLEGFITNSLRKYAVNNMHKHQFGFIPGLSIDECKTEVFGYINRVKTQIGARTAYACMFDFSSAYDTVNRDLLRTRLQNLEILNKNQLDLLDFIHYNIRVRIGETQITTSRGVPQGLTSSPILFDIYV